MRTGLFLLAGFIFMMLMGTVYTWGVFRVEVEHVFQTTTLQSGLPYMTSLFCYALSMMITGRFITLKNTRLIALMGALFVVFGWYFAAQAETLFILTIWYGVFIGIGVGMAYGVPIYLINQTYEKSGFYTGIVLSGFGISPLMTAPLVHYLIQQFGLSTTFTVMSVIAGSVLIPLSVVFRSGNRHKPLKTRIDKSFSMKTFLILYGTFLIATTIGLMMIGLSYRIGVVNYRFDMGRVTLFLAFFAVLNGLARPLFGWIVDRKGFVFGGSLSVGLIMLASLIAFFNQGHSLVLYGLSMGLFWFNLGAWLAMMPISVRTYFGTKYYGKYYGIIFTAYGLGAIIGTLISGVILDVFIDTRVLYMTVFTIVLGIGYILMKFKSHTPIQKVDY